MDASSANAYRPAPTYQNKATLLAANPYLPEKVDLNKVDPQFRDIYGAYNDRVDQLQGSLANTRSQAQSAQQDVQKGYDIATTNAENTYTGNMDTIRSANQDSQLANRLRARALGGAPSSGFLDLANRTDIQSQKDIGKAGQQLGLAYMSADQIASKAYGDIISSLNDAILKIQSDGTLSLRERDQRIQSAKEAAAKAAADAANWASLFGNGDTTNTNTPSVLGAEDHQVPTGTVGNPPDNQVFRSENTSGIANAIGSAFMTPAQKQQMMSRINATVYNPVTGQYEQVPTTQAQLDRVMSTNIFKR